MGAVIFTESAQLPPAVIVPFVRSILVAPAVGAKVPPQVLVLLGAGATTIAPGVVGNVSLKATPLIALFWFGLVMVNVSVDVPPVRIGLGEKSLLICGGDSTVKVAEAEPVALLF